MAERSTNGADKYPEDVFEMIPWYVNGSLSDADAERVERYSAEHPGFAEEIDRQSAIAAGVCMLEPLGPNEASTARSWERLSQQIAAEERARQPAKAQRSWFPSLKGGLALAGTLAAVALVAVMITPLGEPEFVTLTSDPANALVIKFQVAPGTDAAALERILAEHGLKLSGEPTENGVYSASTSEDADPQAAADALMAAPEILFAAPAGEP